MLENAEFYPIQYGEGISPTELESSASGLQSSRIPEVTFAFVNTQKVYKICFGQTEMFTTSKQAAKQIAFLIIVGSIL